MDQETVGAVQHHHPEAAVFCLQRPVHMLPDDALHSGAVEGFSHGPGRGFQARRRRFRPGGRISRCRAGRKRRRRSRRETFPASLRRPCRLSSEDSLLRAGISPRSSNVHAELAVGTVDGVDHGVPDADGRRAALRLPLIVAHSLVNRAVIGVGIKNAGGRGEDPVPEQGVSQAGAGKTGSDTCKCTSLCRAPPLIYISQQVILIQL